MCTHPVKGLISPVLKKENSALTLWLIVATKHQVPWTPNPLTYLWAAITEFGIPCISWCLYKLTCEILFYASINAAEPLCTLVARNVKSPLDQSPSFVHAGHHSQADTTTVILDHKLTTHLVLAKSFEASNLCSAFPLQTISYTKPLVHQGINSFDSDAKCSENVLLCNCRSC